MNYDDHVILKKEFLNKLKSGEILQDPGLQHGSRSLFFISIVLKTI